MKARERNACDAVISGVPVPPFPAAAAATLGATRTNHTAGKVSAHAMTPTITRVLRQSYCVPSHATSGDIVIGATPTPADTSEIAMLRRRSNDAAVADITGAKKLATATPISTP